MSTQANTTNAGSPPAANNTANTAALAKKRHNFESMNKKQLVDLLLADPAQSPSDELLKLLTDIRDELRSIRTELTASKAAQAELREFAVHQHQRILELEASACRNAVVVIDALPAKGKPENIAPEMRRRGLNLDNMNNHFALGRDADKARPVKFIFNSDYAAREFLFAARDAGLKAKGDAPRSVRLARQALNAKYAEAKTAGKHPKFVGGTLVVGQDSYFVNPFTKAIEQSVAPVIVP